MAQDKVLWTRCNIESDIDFLSACKSHNIIRIILLLDLTKPAQIFTIRRLHWCSKQCTVHIRLGIPQVLSILIVGFNRGEGGKMHSISHQLISLCISPSKVDVRQEDGESVIWRVHGWRAVGEEV